MKPSHNTNGTPGQEAKRRRSVTPGYPEGINCREYQPVRQGGIVDISKVGGVFNWQGVCE